MDGAIFCSGRLGSNAEYPSNAAKDARCPASAEAD
jgi:hypothetical protein